MIVYTRRRGCLRCRELFAVDPKRPHARICVPCAEKHSDRRVRERLTNPPREAGPVKRGAYIAKSASLSLEWRDAARCLDAEDPEVFYPAGREGYANTSQIEVAKAFCFTCPVRRQCLDEALARGDDWGIWGGRTPAERRQLVRRNGSAVSR